MDDAARRRLTDELRGVVAAMAEDVRGRLLADGRAREAAAKLHAEERVGDAFEVWTDLLSRRSAVLWVLKSVYVRVLEDRGLLRPLRLADPESQELFARLAPNLGETAYLRWIYRDLATDAAGLGDLFHPQPAEIVLPSDALSRSLIELWRRHDPDSGQRVHRFDGERFDGRLMGDLYQDLDPVVKERYALLQTPGFVLDFILDETLTPAIGEWGADTVRVLDPACGSGHFLLTAFRRLVDAVRETPEGAARPLRDVVRSCLDRVVGIDLNDYACALARARLVMTALDVLGETDLGAARDLHPRVYWADGLVQVERQPAQMDLFAAGQKAAARMTRPEVEAALAPLLRAGFHVVVANPPYITEKDAEKKKYHREVVEGRRRYVSAYREYSLGAPFTERCFQVACAGGFVGLITANSFMKREFGRALISEVLVGVDLTKVVDTSGAFIPGHGTPTVLVFARNQRPVSKNVRAVMGKKGEPGLPMDAERGLVWASIVDGHTLTEYESEYVSVSDVPRDLFSVHPWSLGGGGAAELRRALEGTEKALSASAVAIGSCALTREDSLYSMDEKSAERSGIPGSQIKPFITGEDVRNWTLVTSKCAVWPYDPTSLLALDGPDAVAVMRGIWRWRAGLSRRVAYGKSQLEHGRKWYEYSMFFVDRFREPLSIAYADVATHNQYVLDRGGKVFNQTAPVIKLSENAVEDDHLALLGLLNSSLACFWMKQVFHCKGLRGEGGGVTARAWEQFYALDATKLKLFPVTESDRPEITTFARALDALARTRVSDSPRATIDSTAAAGPAALRGALEARRRRDMDRLLQMVGLQEELDWLVYRAYGLDDGDVRTPETTAPLQPGQRPFEITLAREEADTEWFSRHGWTPTDSLDGLDTTTRALFEARLARTAASRDLGLMEDPNYKRRWYRPDHGAEEKTALTEWLDDRIEAYAQNLDRPFTAREAAVRLQEDPAVLSVAELLEGAHADLERLVAERLLAESVPNCKHHVYKPKGLEKRAVWERTWAEQHKEDRGEPANPEVPPRYTSADFLKPDLWRLRGKLDVPKERYLALTEIPGLDADEALFGWAGWTPGARAQVLVALDEEAQARGATLDERVGLLHAIQSLVPTVAWESKDLAGELQSIVAAYVGKGGVSEEMLARWADTHGARTKKTRGRKRS